MCIIWLWIYHSRSLRGEQRQLNTKASSLTTQKLFDYLTLKLQHHIITLFQLVVRKYITKKRRQKGVDSTDATDMATNINRYMIWRKLYVCEIGKVRA